MSENLECKESISMNPKMLGASSLRTGLQPVTPGPGISQPLSFLTEPGRYRRPSGDASVEQANIRVRLAEVPASWAFQLPNLTVPSVPRTVPSYFEWTRS
jgi:hypothetical protein